MQTNSAQQEILLRTGTNFSSRQWSKKEGSDCTDEPTEKEQLEEACWNDMLREMLPEICGQAFSAKKLYLWKITETASFLELDLGEFPAAKDKYFSIDPYCFVEIQLYN